MEEECAKLCRLELPIVALAAKQHSMTRGSGFLLQVGPSFSESIILQSKNGMLGTFHCGINGLKQNRDGHQEESTLVWMEDYETPSLPGTRKPLRTDRRKAAATGTFPPPPAGWLGGGGGEQFQGEEGGAEAHQDRGGGEHSPCLVWRGR